MFSPPRKMKVAALLCVVLFTVSLVHLFLLRFEAGNVYPRYSSLRSDPLGTRALYESLNRLSGSFAERNFSPWHQIGLDQGITLMIVGLRDNSFRSQRMIVEQLFDRLKHSGGRLVLTFTSNKGAFKARRDEEAQPSNAKKKSLPTDDDPIEEFVEEEDEQIGDSTTDEDVLDAIRDFGAHIKCQRMIPSTLLQN